jgi:lipopolysaccharide export system permease protein
MKSAKKWLFNLRSPFHNIAIMDRYIAIELVAPFLLSVGIFSALGVAIGYLSDLTNKVIELNLPVAQAAKVLLLKIPEFIAYALPISMLLATLMTYGRLTKDSEIIAFKSCGISLYRLIVPAIALSLIVTGITFVFNELVVPTANYQATAILVKYLQEEHTYWLRKDIFYSDFDRVTLPNGEKIQRLKNLFYAEKFDGKKMRSLTILQWLGRDLNRIIVSDSASWNTQQQTWDFFDGTIYNILTKTTYEPQNPTIDDRILLRKNNSTIAFKHQQISLSKVPLDLAIQSRDPYEMNIAQAKEYLKLLKLTGDRQKMRLFTVRMQQKIAFPFICLVFAAIGSALGLRPQSVSRATVFGLCVGIVFLYYLLGFAIGSFGTIGIFPPILAAWLPNFIGLGVGLWLLRANH